MDKNIDEKTAQLKKLRDTGANAADGAEKKAAPAVDVTKSTGEKQRGSYIFKRRRDSAEKKESKKPRRVAKKKEAEPAHVASAGDVKPETTEAKQPEQPAKSPEPTYAAAPQAEHILERQIAATMKPSARQAEKPAGDAAATTEPKPAQTAQSHAPQPATTVEPSTRQMEKRPSTPRAAQTAVIEPTTRQIEKVSAEPLDEKTGEGTSASFPSGIHTVTVSVPSSILRAEPEKEKKQDDEGKPEGERFKVSRSFVMSACACFILVCMAVSGGLWYMNKLVPESFTAGGAIAALLGDNAKKLSVKAEELPQSDVFIRTSSVEEDLSIQFVDAADKLITGVPFKACVTDAYSNVTTAEDDDMDGEIYLEGISSGSYTVGLAEIPQGYTSPAPAAATVAAKIEYKPIQVTVVKQSAEAGKSEDGAVIKKPSAEPTVTVPTNTVEYVVSSSEKKKVTEEKVTGYTFKPELDSTGVYLVRTDGSVSAVVAELDADGNLTGGHTVSYAAQASSSAAEAPAASAAPSASPSADPAATAEATATPSPEPTPEPTPAQPTPTPEAVSTPVELFDTAEPKDMLKDSAGKYIYKVTRTEIKESVEVEKTVYYGWQDISGKRYYYDKTGKLITGTQVISGVTYIFGSDGVLQSSAAPTGGRTLGIDVSTWNDVINWQKVKAAGIDFVMIRCGFRGYGAGKIIEDDMFRQNAAGAAAAGLKVGVYFYTAALNTQEAVEEASAVIQIISGYGITYPVAFDCEYIGGGTTRSNAFDYMSASERTKICIAFCETIKSAGYTPMVYSFKSWLEYSMYTSQFPYRIWLAHVTSAASSSYTGRYDIWQYSFKGSVPGINGSVDMNWSYLGY